MPPFLELDQLVRRFGAVAAVDGVSLVAEKGSVLALLGPSGSGKTTLLRLLAGFEQPDAGRILLEGADLTKVPTARRRFGMVFQHYALFPHLDVAGNVAFGLEMLGLPRGEIARRVDETLALVDLGGFARRRVDELSGGQQQRVAIARALAPEPRVLLLDEPLSNLDPALRERTRGELAAIVRRVGITTVLVTHEQDEAFELGDRIALLRDGRLEQIGSAESLYQAPASLFAARFVGRGSDLRCRIVAREGSSLRIEAAGRTFELPLAASPGAKTTGELVLFLRPESLRLVPSKDGELAGTIVRRRFTGGRALFTLRLPDGELLEVEAAAAAAATGDEAGLRLERNGGGIHLFPAEERAP
jgi:ABC-type Fe3+/spermidine/putrescine transport system ATPase subunit